MEVNPPPPRSALFHIKTRVYPKYLVAMYILKSLLANDREEPYELSLSKFQLNRLLLNA